MILTKAFTEYWFQFLRDHIFAVENGVVPELSHMVWIVTIKLSRKSVKTLLGILTREPTRIEHTDDPVIFILLNRKLSQLG